MVNLSKEELSELKNRFNGGIQIDESLTTTTTKTQLSTGKYVDGYLTEDNTFIIKSVSSFLCG